MCHSLRSINEGQLDSERLSKAALHSLIRRRAQRLKNLEGKVRNIQSGPAFASQTVAASVCKGGAKMR